MSTNPKEEDPKDDDLRKKIIEEDPDNIIKLRKETGWTGES